MGFVSCLEDITDRYFESSTLSDWRDYLGPAPKRRDIEEARYLFGDPLERPRKVIREFWSYYRQQQPLVDHSRGRWEGHLQNVKALRAILAPIEGLNEQASDTWPQIREIERALRHFLRDAQIYGPLSRTALQAVFGTSRAIAAQCNAVLRELKRFEGAIRKMDVRDRDRVEIRQAMQRLKDIELELQRDQSETGQFEDLVTTTQHLWERFLGLFTSQAVQNSYRPALQNLDRFHLNEVQERFVALNYMGEYRIQGASGSGKTIILIHRALRLAERNPAATVRVFTINRALAELLRSSVVAIHGSVPANLHIAAFYDFLLECVGLFEPRERFRLVDDRSWERIQRSWRDFYRHRGRNADQNVFADPAVRTLVRSIERHETGKLDAFSYLREEMIYVQGAYRKRCRQQYFTDSRRCRSITFGRSRKSACLRILQAWEEWLEVGDLCDVDGLTLKAAEYFARPECLNQIREAFPTEFVLIDEMQDFSTLELELVRSLVADLEGQNRFFLVGDLNQKVYPKHHDSRRAGFHFGGKAGILKQNFRNTRQILRAAYNLPQAFPPKSEEDGIEVLAPELSTYEGGRPVVLECTRKSHLRNVLQLVQLRRGSRVAVVGEDLRFLAEVRSEAMRFGLRAHELLRNEDLDLWHHQGDSLAAELVVSRLEAVKGFEFDTVIACDLSEGVIPRQGTPEEEHWRQAAILYSALTRARDELVVTFVGHPSPFLKAMLEDMDLQAGFDEETAGKVLGRA